MDDFGDGMNDIEARVSESDDPDFQYEYYAPYDEETCDPDEQYDVDILWNVTYKENGIRKGGVDFYEIPRSAVSSYDELVDYMVEKIAERHGLTFEHGTDWVFVNENYWKQEFSKVDESLDDDNRDWSANEEEVEIQWMIDDEDFGIVSSSIESIMIDLELVDSFEELVYQVTKEIEKKYDGMSFDYDDEWLFVDEDLLIKRFGYSMNELGKTIQGEKDEDNAGSGESAGL